MSEKRFTFDDEYEFEIYDKQTKKHYDGRIGCQEKLVVLLNEQQATIEQLRQSQDVKEFSALFNQSIALQREIKDLKEENKQLHYKIIELQDKLGMNEKVIDYE